ncbi:hypothetical protein WJX72_002166 [[Myrmecia] bisecta]|uniref:SET domain-containing protein n=1 Tax=[Myrmecia] bisecta TaxID=41462 RepID=A0AAW1R4W5_9CHLO
MPSGEAPAARMHQKTASGGPLQSQPPAAALSRRYEFEGCVDHAPPLQVMGQTLSPPLAQAFDHQLQAFRECKLPGLAEESFVALLSPLDSREAAQKLVSNLQTGLERAVGGHAAQHPATLMASLPADIPATKLVKGYTVSADDPCVTLRGERGAGGDRQVWGSPACSGLMFGNLTALINDPRQDPVHHPEEDVAHAANARILEFRVGCWVFPFVVTIQDVAAGEPLLADYGELYWREGFAERLQLLQTKRALADSTTKRDHYTQIACADAEVKNLKLLTA